MRSRGEQNSSAKKFARPSLPHCGPPSYPWIGLFISRFFPRVGQACRGFPILYLGFLNAQYNEGMHVLLAISRKLWSNKSVLVPALGISACCSVSVDRKETFSASIDQRSSTNESLTRWTKNVDGIDPQKPSWFHLYNMRIKHWPARYSYRSYRTERLLLWMDSLHWHCCRNLFPKNVGYNMQRRPSSHY